jgi:hypothetical protein
LLVEHPKFVCKNLLRSLSMKYKTKEYMNFIIGELLFGI